MLRLLELIQSLCDGESQYLSLLRAKLQEGLPDTLALWLSGPIQGFFPSPYGFESARGRGWTELGSGVVTSSMLVTPSSRKVGLLERSGRDRRDQENANETLLLKRIVGKSLARIELLLHRWISNTLGAVDFRTSRRSFTKCVYEVGSGTRHNIEMED